jgi:hypothetical protein
MPTQIMCGNAGKVRDMQIPAHVSRVLQSHRVIPYESHASCRVRVRTIAVDNSTGALGLYVATFELWFAPAYRATEATPFASEQ